MPMTDQYIRLTCSAIQVEREDRQRKVVNTEGLLESIRMMGVLQPIIVNKGPGGVVTLVAGERRLQASIELGLPDIPVRFADSLDPIEAQIIELEENVKRMDLDWQDLVRACQRIHQLHLSLDPEWTLGETASAIRLTSGTVSLYLRVASELDTDERLPDAGTVREAYNILARRDARAAGDALQEILETSDLSPPADSQQASLMLVGVTGDLVGGASDRTSPVLTSVPMALPGGKLPVDQAILCETFLHWAPKYVGKKFSLIHCDFPYGIEVFSGPQMARVEGQAYGDSKDLYFTLLECLCKNLDRLMAISGHLMFWYSETHGDATRKMFRELAPQLGFHKHPLIWLKSDNAGVASDPRMGPRHTYETCLLASRGSRQILRVVADAYSAPTDKRLHVSTKPEPVLRHFMQMLVDDTTSILDPTCGSASALRVAEELGAYRILGMDVDEQTVGIARVALRNQRLLRSASAKV